MVSKKIIRTLLTILIVFLIISATAAGFYFGFSYVLSQNARFSGLNARSRQAAAAGQPLIDKNTPGSIELIIPRAADTREIAEILRDAKIIDNTFLFILLSKFNGFDGTYIAGTHFVTPSMSYDEIMYLLSQNPQSVKVTFPEGLTYKEVKAKLRKAGVNFDEAVLDGMVRNPQLFLDYDFVTGIAKNEGRDWLLQGYLWPDTYAFDVNTDEETIVRTFLNNTEAKLVDEYYARAVKRGMTMDQVVILASIIQNECTKIDEMRTVSGVFVNRLKKGTPTDVWFPLESCATINYLRKEAGQDIVLWATGNEKTFESPYNTYNVEGLPPGPICSPGEDAIRAALWPDTKDGFLYFCAVGDGSNDFSKTLSEHNSKVEKYRRLAAKATTKATK
jgi:UPF0755 protein